MKIYKQRWTYMLTLPKKQKMKLLTNSLPTLVFKIWVSRWVSKQKNRLSDFSESLLFSGFITLFSDWVNRNLFNDFFMTFNEIALKLVLIKTVTVKPVLKKCNIYKKWVSIWVSKSSKFMSVKIDILAFFHLNEKRSITIFLFKM